MIGKKTDNKRFLKQGVCGLLLAVLTACTVSAGELPSDDLSPFFGFGPMEILKLDYQMGDPIVTDINHDGLNDLVLVNNRKSRIELLLQKKEYDPNAMAPSEAEREDINDIFGAEQTWRFRRVYVPVDVRIVSLAVADVNSDALLDLAYYSNEGVYIVTQQKELAQAQAKKPSSDEPAEPKWNIPNKKDIRKGLSQDDALQAADVNHDGLSDLVLLGDDMVYVFHQQADGGLAHPVRVPSAADKIKHFHVADINGDGYGDVILETGDREFPVRVRLGSDSGRLGPEMSLAMPFPRTVELSSFDGAAEKAMFVSLSELSGRLLINGFEAAVESDTNEQRPVFAYPFEKTELAQKRDIAVADVNADGFDDVIVSDPDVARFLLFLGQSGEGFGRSETFPGLKDMQKLCILRSDKGRFEAVAVLSIAEKIIGLCRYENGRLTFPAIIDVAGEPQAMDAADIDGNGQSDLVYIAQDKQKKQTFTLCLLFDVGQDQPRSGPTLLLENMKDRPKELFVADIDHNGLADVLIVPSFGPLQLVRQVQAGQFEEVQKQDINAGLVSGIAPDQISIASLGDAGASAVLLVDKQFARSLFFDAERGWQVIDQYPPSEPDSVLSFAASAVLRENGSPVSIVTYDRMRNNLNILEAGDGGTYQTTHRVPIGPISIKRIFTGHFTDSKAKSILVGGGNQLLLISLAGQRPVLRELAGFEPDIKDGRYGSLTVGDINHDDKADIILCEQAKNHIEILSFDPQGELRPAMTFKVFESPRGASEDRFDRSGDQHAGEPRCAKVGDVTGDGKNDLILLTHDRLILYPQQ